MVKFLQIATMLSSGLLIVGCGEEQGKPSERAVVDVPRGSNGQTDDESFKCDITLAAGEQSFQFTTLFYDRFAVELDPDDHEKVVAVYDLDALSWRDNRLGRTVTIEECESWASASAARSRRSLSQAGDANLQRFIELSLEPTFEVATEGDGIRLSNAILTYRVSNPLPLNARQCKRFFSYDRLNAYRKAMVERKLPPYPQLAVDDALEERGFAPGRIEVVVATPGGDIALTIRIDKADLTEAETNRVAELVDQAGSS